MKRLAYPILVFSCSLAFAIGARAQVCADYQAYFEPCTGPNGCNQGVAVYGLDFGSDKYCMSLSYVSCCSSQVPDWEVDGICGEDCGELAAFLKDPSVLEFGLTHTLWVKDCSGHTGPYARSWDAPPSRLINLKPKLALSGIGG
ncbi:MAG TPA: hypothetical protein VMD29_08220 [Terracidiphilus sp.]|nr:hypothetical protein [Terracidiphilus sp.]